jgi:MSHA pilin protein MshD
MHPSERRSAQQGFTLLELVVAIVVLGLSFAGFVSVYGTVLRHAAEPQLQTQAVAVAAAYLDEVLGRPYRDPDTGLICGVAEGARPSFDNLCDYDQLPLNGCTATSGACPVAGDCACDRNGLPVDGLRAFAVSLDVNPVNLSGAAGLQVQIQVNHDGLAGDGVRLQAFRAED